MKNMVQNVHIVIYVHIYYTYLCVCLCTKNQISNFVEDLCDPGGYCSDCYNKMSDNSVIGNHTFTDITH